MSGLNSIRVVGGPLFENDAIAAFALTSANIRDFMSRPVYMVNNADLVAKRGLDGIAPKSNRWQAFTSLSLSEGIEQYLRQSGNWIGRGFAAVFDVTSMNEQAAASGRPMGFRYGLGILIHEAAHELANRVESVVGVSQLASHHIQHEVAYTLSDSHGPQFTRAALHLWHRTSQVCRIDRDDVPMAGTFYRMSPSSSYQLALGNELEARRDESIQELLLSRPPELFSRLWLEDLKQRKKGAA